MKILSATALLLVGVVPVLARQLAVRERSDSLLVRTTTIPGPRLSLTRSGLALPAAPGTEELLKSNPEAALRYALIFQPWLRPKAPDPHPDIASTLRPWNTTEEDEVLAFRFVLGKLRDGVAAYLAYLHLRKYGLSR